MKHPVQLVLAALLAAGSGSLQAAEPEPLQPGTQVRGEITSASPRNHSDGSRSHLYVVEIGEDELVRFDVAGPLRAQLTLFDGQDLVRRSGDRGSTTLALRAPKSAAYTLAVSGADSEAFGPYTLSSEVLEGWDGSTLRVGAQITDWLDDKRDLPLRVDRRAMYTIDMRAAEFDAKLAISGNGVTASDDDGGGGTDARLNVLLEPGDYVLTATGWGGDSQGFYDIAVASRPVPSGLNQGGQIRADGTGLQGAFQGTPLVYRFNLREQRLVTVDMRSDDFDSLLVLRGQGVEHYDDDGGDALNARLVRVLQPGDYTIEAGGATSGSGIFSLSLSTATVPEGTGGGALAPGEQREALLLPGATDRFTLAVAEQAEYVIDMVSDDFDSWLELLDADGRRIAHDDDGGGALNARLRISLAPGEYRIEASAISGDGRYRISVSGP